ncbi:putative Tripeptidyl aminopeptidase [Streptomyces afghaniensis 772] [Streptomyces afghaniensis]
MAPTAAAELRGTAVAAARAKAAGIDFGRVPDAQDLPGTGECVRRTNRQPTAGTRPGHEDPHTKQAQGPPPGRPGLQIPGAARAPPAWDLPSTPAGRRSRPRTTPRRLRPARGRPFSAPAPPGPQAVLQGTHPGADAPLGVVAERSASRRRRRTARGCARSGGAAALPLAEQRPRPRRRGAALGGTPGFHWGSSYGTYFRSCTRRARSPPTQRMVFDSAVDPIRRKIRYRNNLDHVRGPLAWISEGPIPGTTGQDRGEGRRRS